MFVVFEGIDGGGKTTLSNLVAARLREGGLRVSHVREGGTFASSVTQAMRELGRDARNVALSPRAELMLYLTREIQLLDEATRPALAENDVVIADRYVYTAEALAVYGRGLAAAEVAPLAKAAMAGVEPDLVVLVDVEPGVARARRRVAKLVARDTKPPSRKGLAGIALQRQLRHGYRELAAQDPRRWLVVDNTETDLDALATTLAARIRGAQVSLPGPVAMPLVHDLTSARDALLAWIDRRAVREPAVAAYFLEGLAGPGFDERRRALAVRAPIVVAAGLRMLDDELSWQLRRELAAVAPDEVARSITGLAAANPAADAMLRSLVATGPGGVADALYGRADQRAWELRAALSDEAQLVSLAMVADARATAARDRWLATRELERVSVPEAMLACMSVHGVAGDEAWKIRHAVRTIAPPAALASTEGLTDDRAWKWRRRWIARAPKIVMKSITGMVDPRAWELRDLVAGRCEEMLDTIIGLDLPEAWVLRDAALERWPASALKSLGPLAASDRGRALIDEALRCHPEDVTVWRQALMRAA